MVEYNLIGSAVMQFWWDVSFFQTEEIMICGEHKFIFEDRRGMYFIWMIVLYLFLHYEVVVVYVCFEDRDEHIVDIHD